MTLEKILWLRICHYISHALLFGMLIIGSMTLIIVYAMDLFM